MIDGPKTERLFTRYIPHNLYIPSSAEAFYEIQAYIDWIIDSCYGGYPFIGSLWSIQVTVSNDGLDIFSHRHQYRRCGFPLFQSGHPGSSLWGRAPDL